MANVLRDRAWTRPRLPSDARLLALARLATWTLAFIAIGLLFSTLLDVGQRAYDDLRYGAPRRVLLSGYVGHGDERRMPTQIITLNLDGQVSTLVLPGGDVDALQVLMGPYVVGDDGAAAVALPELQDVNGDGHVDLLVTVRNETVVYVNRNGQFALITPTERQVLQEAWDE